MQHDPGSEHERLEALVGRWKTEGWTTGGSGTPAARIDAVDDYEWLPGGFALLHRVDARVGDQTVEGRRSSATTPGAGPSSPSTSAATDPARTRRA
jgi:Protein of unknown function (DUF1579)